MSTSPGANATGPVAFDPGRRSVEFDVDGLRRSAVVVIPAHGSNALSVVFVFHGHGGSGAGMDRVLDVEGLWPDAVVVYPDGLTGHKGKTDPAGVQTGWQTVVGEASDRDLAFFDVMVSALSTHLTIARDRIFAMGHSNGSLFVSLLLNQRGKQVAATATLSGQPSPEMLASDPARSMFMSMGLNDKLIPYDMQRQSIPPAEAKLGADPSRARVSGYLRSEPGRGNLELETFIYPGGHDPPPRVARFVVEFFQRHSLFDA